MRPFVLLLASVVLASLACTCGAPAEPEPEVPVEGPVFGTPPRPEAPAPRPRRGNGGGRNGGGGGGGGGVGEAPDDGAETTPPPAPKAPASPPPGITQVSSTSWDVEQSLADEWQDNPSRLAEAVKSGDGYKLRKVREREAYHLGMRSGDVITSVNGYGLGSQAELALAWASLQGEDTFTIAFVRDGATKKHTYRIR